MLKEYSITDVLSASQNHISCLVFPIEKMEKIEESILEWPHRRNFFSILWFLQGTGFCVTDFNEYEIVPYRMFLNTPEQVYNWFYYRSCTGYAIMIDKSLAEQAGFNFNQPYIDILKSSVPLLDMIIREIIHKSENAAFAQGVGIEAEMQYLTSILSGQSGGSFFRQDDLYKTFQQFKALITENDVTVKSMDVYADTLHISTATLNELCQSFAGSSAKQFQLNYKITEAKRLLLYSRKNIADIAYELGFEDPAYFTRIFKKKTQLSPSAFSEKYKK